MCPICLVNLRKAAQGTLRLRDISDRLLEAVGDGGAPWSGRSGAVGAAQAHLGNGSPPCSARDPGELHDVTPAGCADTTPGRGLTGRSAAPRRQPAIPPRIP